MMKKLVYFCPLNFSHMSKALIEVKAFPSNHVNNPIQFPENVNT